MLRLSLILLALAFRPLSLDAKPTHFEIRDAGQRDSVELISDATFEKTVGVSTSILGWLELDPDQPKLGIKGEFEVDLRGVDSGNTGRDAFYREKILNAAEFPSSRFVITKWASSPLKLKDGQTISGRVEGVFTIRGESRTQTIVVKLTYYPQSDKTAARLPGNLIRIASSFSVDLTNYKIVIPESLKNRVSKMVQVSVDMIGGDGATPPLAMDPPKKKPTSPNP